MTLLRLVKIDVVVDVRSNPNSTWAPFANKENLIDLLRGSGIKYMYLGDVLGGHPSGKEYYNSKSGKVDYASIRESNGFREGITRLLNGTQSNRICLVCAEESPAHCHRSLLVGNALSQLGVTILHLRADGRIQTDEDLAKERAGVSASQQTLRL